jgi:hypothetical protein
MATLFVLLTTTSNRHYTVQSDICIVDRRFIEGGARKRDVIIEYPLVMGEAFGEYIAKKLGITPICVRIERKPRVPTWHMVYDRLGARPLRRIQRLLMRDSQIRRIHVDTVHDTGTPKKTRVA